MSLVRNASAALVGAALCAAALVSAPAAQGTPQRTAGARPSASPAAAPSAAAPSAPAPSAAARPTSAATAAAGDTLHYQVRAGQPFLVVLPARADGRPAAYRAVSAPAMSWLVDRSFFWQTLPTERGVMPVVFEPTPGGGAAGGEPLVLMVEVVG